MTDRDTDTTTDAQRRILDRFGSDDTLDGLTVDVRPQDIKLMVASVFAGVLLYEAIESLAPAARPVGMLMAVLLPIAMAAVIYVAPDHTTPLGWISEVVSFWRREKELSAVGDAPDARTDTLTQVARFHPGTDTVERTDGDLVGAVRVTPANMSLATSGEWDSAADDLGDAFNSLEFDFLMHSTAREMDTETVVDPYARRLDDQDVQDTPALKSICETYTKQLPSELKWREAAVREYYVFVPVSVRDIQMATRGAWARLGELPVIGGVIETVIGETSGMDDAEIRRDQLQTLSQRLSDVESAIGGVGECRTEVLTSNDLARVIEEFWTGERTEYADGSERMRSVPVVTSTTLEGMES